MAAVGAGATFAAGDAGGRVGVYTPTTGDELWLQAPEADGLVAGIGRAHEAEVLDLAASPDGRLLYTLATLGVRRSELSVWDLAAAARIGRLKLDAQRNRLAVSDDGAWLALAGRDGEVELWSTAALLATPAGR